MIRAIEIVFICNIPMAICNIPITHTEIQADTSDAEISVKVFGLRFIYLQLRTTNELMNNKSDGFKSNSVNFSYLDCYNIFRASKVFKLTKNTNLMLLVRNAPVVFNSIASKTIDYLWVTSLLSTGKHVFKNPPLKVHPKGLNKSNHIFYSI